MKKARRKFGPKESEILRFIAEEYAGYPSDFVLFLIKDLVANMTPGTIASVRANLTRNS